MPKRSKIPPMPSTGNPLLTRMTTAERRLDAHDVRLAEHDIHLELDDERLNDQEAALAEMNSDIALLTAVALRSRKRDRAALARRAKRRGSRTGRRS